MFESMFFYWSGVYVFMLIMAGGYSQYLAKSLGWDAQADTQPIERTA